MKFLHYITTENGSQVESVYSNSANPKMSFQASATAQNGSYKIWNKETNEVTEVGA